MNVTDVEKCRTCQGLGEVPSAIGPAQCPDCLGLGKLPSGTVLAERRLRELEGRYADGAEDHAPDVRWLIAEVRRSHHALVQILAAGQEIGADHPIGRKIAFLANDVLGVYRPTPD
jgi:hypothetical protein